MREGAVDYCKKKKVELIKLEGEMIPSAGALPWAHREGEMRA